MQNIRKLLLGAVHFEFRTDEHEVVLMWHSSYYCSGRFRTHVQ